MKLFVKIIKVWKQKVPSQQKINMNKLKILLFWKLQKHKSLIKQINHMIVEYKKNKAAADRLYLQVLKTT